MRKSVSVLVLVVGALWSSSQAKGASICDALAGNLLTNCGFETGDFTGWTIGGNDANPGGNYYGVDNFDANSGNTPGNCMGGPCGAFMSQDFFVGTAPVTLSQTVATSVGSVYFVSYFLEQDTPPEPGSTHMFTANWGGTQIQSLTPTAPSASDGTFVEYSFVETATAAATTLQFAFENDDDFWSFDDVSVVAAAVTTTPEPSTGLAGGIALGALLLLWSRRRLA
jgi:hypothetical protein